MNATCVPKSFFASVVEFVLFFPIFFQFARGAFREFFSRGIVSWKSGVVETRIQFGEFPEPVLRRSVESSHFLGYFGFHTACVMQCFVFFSKTVFVFAAQCLGQDRRSVQERIAVAVLKQGFYVALLKHIESGLVVLSPHDGSYVQRRRRR